MRALARAAKAVRDGDIDGDEFVRRTDEWARRVTAGMLRRYRALPTWLSREDLEQEVRLRSWLHLGRYDEERSQVAPIDRFVSFATRRSAEKLLMRAQGIDQHTRKGHPRFEPCYGSPADLDEIGRSPMAEDDLPDEIAARSERFEVLTALCNTIEEQHAVRAIERARGGDFEEAGRALYADRDARLDCGLMSEEHGARVVGRAWRRLLRDYGGNGGNGNGEQSGVEATR